MSENPEDYVRMLIDSGADLIEYGIKHTAEARFHTEVARGIGRELQSEMEETGAKLMTSPAGIAELDTKNVYEPDIPALIGTLEVHGFKTDDYVRTVRVPAVPASTTYAAKTVKIMTLIAKLGDTEGSRALREAMHKSEPVKGVKYTGKGDA